MSPQEVLEFAKTHDARQLDLRFTDIPGLQHHVSYPISKLKEDVFEEGFGMDGSSIRGWAAINESDMLLIPDPEHGLHGPVRRNADAGDVRRRQGPDHQAALRARPALDRAEGRAVPARTAASPTRPSSAPKPSSSSSTTSASTRTTHSGFYFIDAEEGRWNSGRREEQPRLPAALQGRLLPGAADRPLPGSAQRDGGDDDPVRAATSSATTTKSPPAASARSISASTRW